MHALLRAAACAACCLASPAAHAALPDSLTPAGAAALARQRPECVAAHAAVRAAAADSVAARVGPVLGWTLAHHRAGEQWLSGEERGTQLGVERSFEPWGRRAAEGRAAGARRVVSQLEAEALETALVLGAQQALAAAAMAERRAGSLDQVARFERRFERSLAARVADGSSTPLEGRLAGFALAHIESRLREARGRAAAARLDLAAALGIGDSDWAARVMLAAPPEPDTSISADQVRDAAGASPAVAVAEARHRAALERVRASALAGRPDLTMGLALGTGRTRVGRDELRGDPGGLTGIEGEEREVELSLSGSLPDRAAGAAARARAAAEESAANAALQAARREALAAAMRAHAEHDWAAREALMWRAQAARASADLARVDEALGDSRITMTEALALRRSLSEVLDAALSAETRALEARAALERACGRSLDDLKQPRRR